MARRKNRKPRTPTQRDRGRLTDQAVRTSSAMLDAMRQFNALAPVQRAKYGPTFFASVGDAVSALTEAEQITFHHTYN